MDKDTMRYGYRYDEIWRGYKDMSFGGDGGDLIAI